VNKPKNPRLLELAESLVNFGKKQGADEIEVSLLDGNEFNVDVRMGRIENLVEAGSRYLSLRVIKDQKTAYASSSDLKQQTLHRLVKNAVRRAEFSNGDECLGLPSPAETTYAVPALDIFDPCIAQLSPQKKISLALETEQIALADKRITNSHGASFETKVIHTALANSLGFLQDYRETFNSLSIGIQAGESEEKVEGYWSCSKRFFEELQHPEQVAKTAVERTVRQLHPRKIKTQNVPVVFEPPMTSWLLGFLFSCVSGTAVYQKLSFLANKLGEKIAADSVTVIDNGRLLRKLGTSPFDTEGVPTRKSTVIHKGIMKSYLNNTYTAKKLNLKSTGNADGVGIGPNNFYLEAGNVSPEGIIESLDRGMILIRTLGHGLNPVTGDISRGAFGLWVEKGAVVYPVSEMTIAGNLGTILKDIEMVGDDLDFRSTISGPTIKIRELTIAGE
jgi:PmbA protein